MPQKSAWLAGSTGLVGGHLARELASTDFYRSVTALVRRPQQAPTKITQRIVDFEQLDSSPTSDVGPVDDVFCALGTTIKKAGSQPAFRRVDRDYVVNLAQLARQNGAKQFVVVSSVGADANSSNFYLRTKGEMEQALANIGFERLFIFRPSLLLGERAESRAGEKVAMSVMPLLAPLMFGSMRKYRPIHASQVARAMLAVAQTHHSAAVSAMQILHYDEIVKFSS